MGLMRYCIGAIAALIVYWMFFKKGSHKEWYTCVLAVIFIFFTMFTLDFVGTTFFEGEPQAGMVALLFFGLVDLVIFTVWKFSPKIAEKIGKGGKAAVKGAN